MATIVTNIHALTAASLIRSIDLSLEDIVLMAGGCGLCTSFCRSKHDIIDVKEHPNYEYSETDPYGDIAVIFVSKSVFLFHIRTFTNWEIFLMKQIKFLFSWKMELTDILWCLLRVFHLN